MAGKAIVGPILLISQVKMQLSEYRHLPDYMKPAEVERYCFLILQESSLESVTQTLEKLREMSDRQWHTYELPSKELRNKLKNWLIQNWTSNSSEYLESMMVLSYCFGLDKEFFSQALAHYDGKFKVNFQRDLENSPDDRIDPWWRLRSEDPKELAETFTEQLAASLSGRDWEDSYLEEAMNNRKKIVQQLVKLGERAVYPLVGLLSHSDWAVRGDAATILGYIKNQLAIKPLLAIMENDESLSVKLKAASALDKINTLETIQATKSWYRKNQISAQKRVDFKISEYLLYGETDAILLDRARQLANCKNVTIKIILESKQQLSISQSPSRKAQVIKILELVELSADDVAYLEEPYELL